MPLLMIHTIDFLHINMTLKCLHLLHQGFEYRAPPTNYPITITANYSECVEPIPRVLLLPNILSQLLQIKVQCVEPISRVLPIQNILSQLLQITVQCVEPIPRVLLLQNIR
jgi:hypothetical protein